MILYWTEALTEAYALLNPKQASALKAYFDAKQVYPHYRVISALGFAGRTDYRKTLEEALRVIKRHLKKNGLTTLSDLRLSDPCI